MFDNFQQEDLPRVIDFLSRFWQEQAATRAIGSVAPSTFESLVEEILDEPLPIESQGLETVLKDIQDRIVPRVVKTSHPMFMAFVTPPSLDIGALADAVTGILNQNVMLASVSPSGTSVEETVIKWLGEIVGYGHSCGGIIVSGGSESIENALAIGRRHILGDDYIDSGVYCDPRPFRIYCSDQTHSSVLKAAVATLGIGKQNVVPIRSDKNHEICVEELNSQIENDVRDKLLPGIIVGNAGTFLTGAFDDLKALREVADCHNLWLHVDAAYGGFLRLAAHPPAHSEDLSLADSVTLDPHKLLFVPFDCGCLLVKDKRYLLNTFGVVGPHVEPSKPSTSDFARLGPQLGRSMKALKVWLTLKYMGVARIGEEITRLMNLAQYLAELVQSSDDLELLGPVSGISVCFRWKGSPTWQRAALINHANEEIVRRLIHDGIAYVSPAIMKNTKGIRACMVNFRTEQHHLDLLLSEVKRIATDLSGAA